MIEKWSIKELTNYRAAVEKYCPRSQHTCFGLPLSGEGRRVRPCPYRIDGCCMQGNIRSMREKIIKKRRFSK